MLPIVVLSRFCRLTPARHPDERGCAPDYTVFVSGRCWIIELKTESGSHRPKQIPDYFERAHHYHPQLEVDITYLTAVVKDGQLAFADDVYGRDTPPNASVATKVAAATAGPNTQQR